MKHIVICIGVMLAFSGLRGAELMDVLPEIGAANQGLVAFCRPSVVDELQIIGQPRTLSEDEAKELAAVFGGVDTYYQRSSTGSLVGGRSLCLPHWDFKILLGSAEADRGVAIRLCSDCSFIALQVDGRIFEAPTLRPEAMEKLTVLLDGWFPGWAEVSRRNREETHELAVRNRVWRVHDLGAFALSLPRDFTRVNVQGEDSYIGRFESAEMEIEFDLGAYADPLNYESTEGFVRKTQSIAGREAILATWKREGEYPHVTAVHFPKLGATGKLTVYIFAKKSSALPVKIVEGIKFNAALPPHSER